MYQNIRTYGKPKRKKNLASKYARKKFSNIPKGFRVDYRTGCLKRIEGYFEGDKKMTEFEIIGDEN